MLELGLDLGEEFGLVLARPRPTLAGPPALELCAALAAEGVVGTIDCTSALVGAWLELAVAPGWAIDLPPGRMLPEKAALSDFWRVWYLEMLTEEIENSTMNSAISSVIMSA